jgi:hypothetical protein
MKTYDLFDPPPAAPREEPKPAQPPRKEPFWFQEAEKPKPPWKTAAPLTYRQLLPMLEKGELSTAVYYRRHLLLQVADLALTARSHTPMSRWRVRKFRGHLESLEGNDEIEVEGETLCEVVMLAMEATPEYY